MRQDKLTTIIALVVVVMWAIAIGAGIATSNFSALAAISPVMLIICGFLFGRRTSGNGNGHGNGGSR